MKIVADFHIHSKYSRAVSPKMVLEEIDKWVRLKGVNIISAPDFTHPAWFKELKEKLEPAESGLYRLKTSAKKSGEKEPRFILATEISCIYSKNGKTRRIHVLIFAPSLEVVEKINNHLGIIGNLGADGRPILGLDAKELLKICLDASPDCFVVPAHIWTPWFSLFGSKSGFDSIEECFDEHSKYIYAVETGLSSDPDMNWRIKDLDNRTIISGSDAHSLPHIGREACVFDIEKEKISYGEIIRIIKEKDRQKFMYTIEFFPEEGIYHYDGHRDAGHFQSPEETKKLGGFCKYGDNRRVTIGVAYRVEELAARPSGFKPERMIPFKKLVPLDEIISEALGVGEKSKAVQKEYDSLINKLGPELDILADLPIEKIKEVHSRVGEGIARMREEKLYIRPGYDGVYGEVKIFGEVEGASAQKSLF